MRFHQPAEYAVDHSTSTVNSGSIKQHLKPIVAIVAVLVAIASFSTACESGPPTYYTDIVTPGGDGPLRYRDSVFPNVTKTLGIAWGSAPNFANPPVEVPLKLDLYQPTGDTATARPAIVVAHSGGFYTGTRTNAVSVDLATKFAMKGYVAISIDYRLLSPVDCGSKFTANQAACGKATMAAMSDGQAAVRWLRANANEYGIDTNRIAMIGDSAGALMSSLAGILPFVPLDPTNPLILDIMQGAPQNVGNPTQLSAVQAWASISGGLPPAYTTGLANQLAASPIKPAPGYLFSGTNDNQTPYSWSTALRDELVKTNTFTAFMGLDGAGHVPYTQYKDTFNSQSANWFYFMMNLPDAAQSGLPAT